jgi:hypothetical protein
MHEHIVTVLGLDEAEAFALVEPFDFALHHRRNPPFIEFFKGGLRRPHKKTATL